jgi:hypothetical protein
VEEGVAVSDELERRYEGHAVLQALLTASGSVADVDDVVGAFAQAVKDGVPPAVVIQALWEDEPRFESPKKARALFANLLGLYDLVEAGQTINLEAQAKPLKRPKATAPAPFALEGPDDAFVEAAWRYFDDHPKAREKLAHAFDAHQDALVSWLDAQGLDDDAFVLAQSLVSDIFAMMELGGATTTAVPDAALRGAAAALPPPFGQWLEEGVFEAREHESAPLAEAKAEEVLRLTQIAAGALWKHRRASSG